MQQKTSVNIIAKNTEGKYLLQMRNDNEGICDPLMWNLFGGKVEQGENLIEAGTREFFEEAGIHGEKDDYKLLEHIVYNDTKKEKIDTIYLVEYIQPLVWEDIRLKEGAGAGFFTIEEMKKINITDRLKKLLEIFTK